jgi:hypothetical protein
MKWAEPPGPIPSWLRLADEVTENNDTKPKNWASLSEVNRAALYVKMCFLALRKLGLSHWHALEVLSNSCLETGWGSKFRAWNLGGWKINESEANFRRAQGKRALWYRAPGNKAPGATLEDYKGGDPPWCYYRAFASVDEFFELWLLRFTPKPGTVNSKHRYFKTGNAFWANKEEWFYELCVSGYKGQNTAKAPQGSVNTHKSVFRRCLIILTQSALGVTPDGAWGPMSSKALRERQAALGLPVTGLCSIEVLEKLYP